MALVTKSFTFVDAAVILASEHNTNFDTLYNLVNGALDNANLAAGAAIVDTKLAQITTANKVHTSALVAGSQTKYDMLYYNGSAWVRQASGNAGTINFIIDGGGATITTGIAAGFVVVDFPCTITRAVALTDRLTVTTVDVRKSTYGTFPPKGSNTICGTSKLILTGASKYMDDTLAAWTTSIAAGDILRYCVHANDSAQEITCALKFRRP